MPTLAQAFYFTAEEKYAAHAALLLRTWFLDPATRMNPHLKYAQFIPGRNQGRYSGIVDTESLIGLPDAIGLLAGYKGWTTDDQKGMEKWLGAYCDWLVTSDFGKQEAKSPNNHGTVYDAQVVSLALFSGKTDLARTVLEAAKTKRIAALIEPDGTQPSELRRTKAWSYGMKNLMNLFWLAAMGERAGVDLWNYQSADGRSIRKALDFLVPFATGEKKWPYQELTSKTNWKPTGLGSFLRQATLVYNEPRYAALLRQQPDLAADRNSLFWPLSRENGVGTGRP